MKILFVENRYKTGLWEVIGREFKKEGHEIHWIVQNHFFKPSFGSINILPYPRKLTKPKNYTPEIKKIIQADRGLNYFGIKSDDFIFWYEHEIEIALDKIKPEMVFGESTLFHELLVIKACKQRGILYLHPSSCRYPKNRFSFYQYDTLIPYGNSGEQLPVSEAKNIAHAIGKRLALPDYMNVSKNKISRGQWIKDRVKLTLAYYFGERYNTPSPFMKKKVNSYFNKQIKEWENLAVGIDGLKEEFYVLYAMQMQPEANIDVWGHPYNNQTKVIQRILNDLGANEKLIIKPNPKSKYEISSELIKLVKENPKQVIALKHSSKMDELWPFMDLVVTITGTISIECIFDNKPVVLLGQGLQATQKNCVVLDANEHLQPIIQKVKTGTFPMLTEDEKVAYLQLIMNTSFKGVNGDGLHNKSYLEDEVNMTGLMKSYFNSLND